MRVSQTKRKGFSLSFKFKGFDELTSFEAGDQSNMLKWKSVECNSNKPSGRFVYNLLKEG